MARNIFKNIFFIIGLYFQIYVVRLSFLNYFVKEKYNNIFFGIGTYWYNNNLFISSLLGAISIFISILISKNIDNKNINDTNNINLKVSTPKRIFTIPFLLLLVLPTTLSVLIYRTPNNQSVKQLVLFGFMLLSLFFTLKINFKSLKRSIKHFSFKLSKDFYIIISFCSFYLMLRMFNLISFEHFHWGDEGAFYHLANNMIQSPTSYSFFDQLGVYGQHTMASSMIQALLMAPFGVSMYSFRMSNVLAIMITIIPVYLISKEIFSRKVAIISSFLICFSHYFYNFSYCSHDHIIGVPFAAFTIYFFLLTIFRKSRNYAVITGILSGFCCYVFSVAILSFVIFLPSLLLLMGKNFKLHLKFVSIIYFIVLLFASPMYLRVPLSINKLYFFQHSMSTTNEVGLNALLLRLHVGFVDAISVGENSHWVMGTVLDAYSNFFLYLGLILLVYRIIKFKNEKLKLFSFLMFFEWLILTVSNRYHAFPTTRVMYVYIYWIIVASFGIVTFIESFFRKKYIGYFSFLLVIGAINYELTFNIPFKFQYIGSYESSVLEIGSEENNVTQIYMISHTGWNEWHDKYFDAHLTNKDIKYVQNDKLDKLPLNLSNDKIIVFNDEFKDSASKIMEKYKAQHPFLIRRENINTRAISYIIGLKEPISIILDKSMPNKILASIIKH